MAADGIYTTVVGVDRLAAAFAADATAAELLASRTTLAYGQRLLTAVRGRASGRPGPRAQTGDYRRSIALAVVNGPGVHRARVGTSSPQAARLEFGFNDTDVLGRRFNQPPLPHFGPAYDLISTQYQQALVAGVAAIIAR